MWVVRNWGGNLELWKEKPKKIDNGWYDDTDEWTGKWDRITDKLSDDYPGIFPDLKWDDCPVEVSIVIKKVDEQVLDHLADEYSESELGGVHYPETDEIKKYFKAGYIKSRE